MATSNNLQITVRPAARLDLLDHFDYLDREAGCEAAERFVIAVEKAINLLPSRPRLGRTCGFAGRISSHFRQWPVPGFEKWLIFYLPFRNGVDVLRIVHGA